MKSYVYKSLIHIEDKLLVEVSKESGKQGLVV